MEPRISRMGTNGLVEWGHVRRGATPYGVGVILGGGPGVSLRATPGSYEGCQAVGAAADSGGEGRCFPGCLLRFPSEALTLSVFLNFPTLPKQRLSPGAFFARGVFASFFRCASGRGMVSLSARQPCTFRASSSYPYADSQSGYIMGYPIPIQAGASGSIYVANFVTGGPVSLFKPVGERAPLHS